MSSSKPLLNFVHANGFPAGSYRSFLALFADDYDTIALDQYGHNHRYPAHSSWQYLVQELIHYVKQQNEPIICVGHSFGGVISFLAACQHPELFKGVIMLDPPVFTGRFSWLLSFAKKTRLIDKFSPSGKSKNRKQHWPLDTDMVNYFSSKGLFKHFDPRCLKDYVDSAIIRRNNQQELGFSREVETEIFRNVPNNLRKYRDKLCVPAALIYGEKSNVLSPEHFQRFANMNNISLSTMPAGGHMFPLEKPEETAIMVKEIINGWK